MNIIDFNDVVKEFKIAKDNVRLLQKSQSEIDTLENVIKHQVETAEKASASEGYKYFKKWQDTRIKRRIIKQQLQEQQCIVSKLKPFIDSYRDTQLNIQKATVGGKEKYVKNFEEIDNILKNIKTL